MIGEPRDPSTGNATIAALVCDAGLRVMLNTALSDQAQLVFVSRGEELVQRIWRTPIDLALVSERDVTGIHTAPTVALVCKQYPHLPVVAVCALERTSGADVLLLAKAGVSELVIRGRDDVRNAVNRVMRATSRQEIARFILAGVEGEVPEEVRPIVRLCLERANDALTVTKLARLVGVHRRTLHNRLRRISTVTPRALIGWTRILVAGYHLEKQQRSVESIAFTLGFSSASALWNMIHRYMGCSPQRMRVAGGLAYGLAQFRSHFTRTPDRTQHAGMVSTS